MNRVRTQASTERSIDGNDDRNQAYSPQFSLFLIPSLTVAVSVSPHSRIYII